MHITVKPSRGNLHQGSRGTKQSGTVLLRHRDARTWRERCPTRSLSPFRLSLTVFGLCCWPIRGAREENKTGGSARGSRIRQCVKCEAMEAGCLFHETGDLPSYCSTTRRAAPRQTRPPRWLASHCSRYR
ncbi:unnamed protein product [Ectocarpus fasciculatus]